MFALTRMWTRSVHGLSSALQGWSGDQAGTVVTTRRVVEGEVTDE